MRKMTALMLLPLLIAGACRKDAPPSNAVAGEAASDGKVLVTGCVWYYSTSGSECSTKDVLAFCDDGRVCVRSNGDWKCVVRP